MELVGKFSIGNFQGYQESLIPKCTACGPAPISIWEDNIEMHLWDAVG